MIVSTITKTIIGFCDVVRVACTGVNVATSVVGLITNENRSALKGASVVSRAAILALDAIDTIGRLSGNLSANNGINIKSLETLVRVIDFPIQLAKVVEENEENTNVDSATKIISIMEQGLLAPLLGIVRSNCQALIYEEQTYLQMTQEELKTAVRPVFDKDDEGNTIITGYKPVNLDECQENLKNLSKTVATFGSVEVLAQARTIETIYKCIALRFFINHEGADPEILPQTNATGFNIEEMFDLKKLAIIPPELEDDVVFDQFKCAINHMPVRDPVADPTSQNRTLYERSAIVTWLRRHPFSPITGQPLTVPELTECPTIKLLIDNRLEFHSQGIKDFLKTRLAENVDLDLLDKSFKDLQPRVK